MMSQETQRVMSRALPRAPASVGSRAPGSLLSMLDQSPRIGQWTQDKGPSQQGEGRLQVVNMLSCGLQETWWGWGWGAESHGSRALGYEVVLMQSWPQGLLDLASLSVK